MHLLLRMLQILRVLWKRHDLLVSRAAMGCVWLPTFMAWYFHNGPFLLPKTSWLPYLMQAPVWTPLWAAEMLTFSSLFFTPNDMMKCFMQKPQMQRRPLNPQQFSFRKEMASRCCVFSLWKVSDADVKRAASSQPGWTHIQPAFSHRPVTNSQSHHLLRVCVRERLLSLEICVMMCFFLSFIPSFFGMCV